MLRNILNLNGASELNQEEQRSIAGGLARPCAPGQQWVEIPWGEVQCLANGLQWLNGTCYYCY